MLNYGLKLVAQNIIGPTSENIEQRLEPTARFIAIKLLL